MAGLTSLTDSQGKHEEEEEEEEEVTSSHRFPYGGSFTFQLSLVNETQLAGPHRLLWKSPKRISPQLMHEHELLDHTPQVLKQKDSRKLIMEISSIIKDSDQPTPTSPICYQYD